MKRGLFLFSVRTPHNVTHFHRKEEAKAYRDTYNELRKPNEREVGITYGPDHRYYRGVKHG